MLKIHINAALSQAVSMTTRLLMVNKSTVLAEWHSSFFRHTFTIDETYRTVRLLLVLLKRKRFQL